jgi:arsenite methyltransferase
MSQSNLQIHEVVREHYGAIARSTSEGEQTRSCCSPDASGENCGCSPQLYDDILLAGLPADVTGLSLGCGDPVTIASLKPGETVLDLGSGGGIDCFLAAQQVGDTGYVIGVDMTPDMLMKANTSKVSMGVNNVEFRKGQIEALPVTDNSIDVIMSNCVINLSPDKETVFKEAFRVLKPGGRVSISDIVTEGDFSSEMRAELTKWAECVTGAIDLESYISSMQDAGFTDIQVVSKVDNENLIPRQEEMPRIFSARVTAYKPA